MKIKKLKKELIDFNIAINPNPNYINDFSNDIDECQNVWDILNVLEDYGWDEQGGIELLFSILIE